MLASSWCNESRTESASNQEVLAGALPMSRILDAAVFAYIADNSVKAVHATLGDLLW